MENQNTKPFYKQRVLWLGLGIGLIPAFILVLILVFSRTPQTNLNNQPNISITPTTTDTKFVGYDYIPEEGKANVADTYTPNYSILNLNADGSLNFDYLISKQKDRKVIEQLFLHSFEKSSTDNTGTYGFVENDGDEISNDGDASYSNDLKVIVKTNYQTSVPGGKKFIKSKLANGKYYEMSVSANDFKITKEKVENKSYVNPIKELGDSFMSYLSQNRYYQLKSFAEKYTINKVDENLFISIDFKSVANSVSSLPFFTKVFADIGRNDYVLKMTVNKDGKIQSFSKPNGYAESNYLLNTYVEEGLDTSPLY